MKSLKISRCTLALWKIIFEKDRLDLRHCIRPLPRKTTKGSADRRYCRKRSKVVSKRGVALISQRRDKGLKITLSMLLQAMHFHFSSQNGINTNHCHSGQYYKIFLYINFVISSVTSDTIATKSLYLYATKNGCIVQGYTNQNLLTQMAVHTFFKKITISKLCCDRNTFERYL